MEKEKRRSDRILLTIPLSIQGKDENGQPFQLDAQTSILNRHGARIRVNRRLHAGEIVRITNLVGRRSSDFRVVGPVAPFTRRGGEYGVEYVDQTENIWGIQFPPALSGEATEPTALLECRKCGQVRLSPVSLVEVEVLETSGILKKQCESCGVVSLWSYAEHRTGASGAGAQGGVASGAAGPSDAPGRERRRHRRVSLQLPVRICDYDGNIEITRSENISKGGFCFISETPYEVGEGVMVTCPYNSKVQNIEVRARIASRREIEGTPARVYGVQFLESSR